VSSVLTRMAEEGFTIPALPCALIEAKNRKEAAEKILLISSQYGKMTNNSLEQFLAENDLDLMELNDELELPSIDLEFSGRLTSAPLMSPPAIDTNL